MTTQAGPSQDASVPPVFAPPPGHLRFPHYDSLRGIAALMVLVFHALIISEAFGSPLAAIVSQFELSITILFMLSAFLLYRPFVAARMGKAPDVRIGDYALRRTLRILPGYWVALIVLSTYPGLNGVFTWKWWVYFGLLQNYHPLYGHQENVMACHEPPYPCPGGPESYWSVLENVGGIIPAWTLGVEVAFYALLPLFVIFMGWASTRMRRPIRFELAVLAVLGVLSVLSRIYAFDLYIDGLWLLKTLPTIFLWLGAGMALAVLSAHLQGREHQSRVASFVTRRPGAVWGAAIALFAVLVLTMAPTPDIYGQTVAASAVKFVAFTVITVLLLLPATFGYETDSGWPRRVLANKFIAWIGLIAYGLYLYHVPIMIKLNSIGVADIQDPFLRWTTLTFGTLALSIACGAASYYLVERWFLKYKYRRKPKRRADRARTSTGPTPAASAGQLVSTARASGAESDS